MQIFLNITKTQPTAEELAQVLQKAAEVAPLIEIEAFAARQHAIVLRDETGKKIGEMGAMG